MKKILKIVFGLICISLFMIILYNVYDNNRIKLVKEIIEIVDLPSDFEGFKILQITDLHGKTFGKNQEKLVDIINSLNYDMLAITGDMVDKHTDDTGPFIEMLDGIENKEYIFFVDGNVDKPSLNEVTNEITEEGQFLIDKGCNILEKPYEIKRGESSLWISRFLDKNQFYALTCLVEESDDSVKVVLTHYPRHDYHFGEGTNTPDYDLVLAGHYHAGQWRIPFYGALFVPDAFSGLYLFPNQDEVKGLITWGDTNQYVSAGLGASSSCKFLQFRLFNTPEINLLTLKSK